MLNNPLRFGYLLDHCFIKLPDFTGSRGGWQNVNTALQSQQLLISKDEYDLY